MKVLVGLLLVIVLSACGEPRQCLAGHHEQQYMPDTVISCGQNCFSVMPGYYYDAFVCDQYAPEPDE